MQDAIILGGGISGLTAAYLLAEQGLDVTVIERSAHAGGPITTLSEAGYLVERGPNSLLLPEPWVESYLAELGLAQELLEVDPTANKRYIVRDGVPVAAPMSPWQAVTTPLFSLRAKIGFLGEPFRQRISDDEAATESVASFVERRMGREFLDYAIDPFVSGIYAGDPNDLILEHAFPLMRGFERDGGSILRGALRYKKERRRSGADYKKRSVSFRRGLGCLPATLAQKLGNRLHLESTASAIERKGDAWRVAWHQHGETHESSARHLLVCLPSHATKSIVWPSAIGAALKATPDLAYPAVHSLALGFDRGQIDHPLDGFGALAPSKEKLSILGVLFSSSLFPGRAPEGKCLLTVMLGGARRPDLAQTESGVLTELALTDLRSLLGLRGDPHFQRLTTWPRAIPQYTASFAPWRNALRNLEAAFAGLRLGGNAVDGIALGASILSGRRLARTILEADS